MTFKNRQILFLSETKLTSSNARKIINAMEANKITHESRGFNIKDSHMDNKLNIQALIYFLCSSTVHIYAKDEHVGFIKKAIGTVKKRTRSMCHAVL